MANLSDSTGIFAGELADIFTEMEALIARDGDVAYAAQQMRAAMMTVISTRHDPDSATTGSAVTERAPL